MRSLRGSESALALEMDTIQNQKNAQKALYVLTSCTCVSLLHPAADDIGRANTRFLLHAEYRG